MAGSWSGHHPHLPLSPADTPAIVARQEPEPERLAGRPQQVPDGVPGRPRFDVHRDLVEPGLGHLRRHGALPDQPIKPGLVAVEDVLELIGVPSPAGGADGFVGLLCAALLLAIVARFGERSLPDGVGGSPIDLWVEAFKHKRQEIASVTCPT